MQELIDRLIEKTGITAVQAVQAIEVIKDFVKEKFPMVGGAVDGILGGTSATAAPGGTDDILAG